MASPAASKVRRKEPAPETLAFPSTNRPSANLRQKLIDEFGALSEEISKLRLKERRFEQLRQMILAGHAEAGPTEAVDEDGKAYSVHISPCAEIRMIFDQESLANRLGYKTFFAHCTFSLEKLDSLILPKDQTAFVKRESIGPRIVKSIPRYAEPVT